MNNRIDIHYIEKDFLIEDLNDENWKKAKAISIEKYWSGENAPVGRHLSAKLLWSKAAFYVRFEANQTEPLNISAAPNFNSKTVELWERDVFEIFVAPDENAPQKYFEFEIAPTGEWLDLGIYQKPDERVTDWGYNSNMKSVARIEKDKVLTAIKIEWNAFGKIPQAGDVWRGNIFRCVGAGEMRGFLAWSPTATEQPNFHVPERFGEFEFE